MAFSLMPKMMTTKCENDKKRRPIVVYSNNVKKYLYHERLKIQSFQNPAFNL